MQLLRIAWRKVQLLRFAHVVVAQSIQMHLVELLILLWLHVQTVLLRDLHAGHLVVLALWSALAERRSLVLFRI